MNKIKIFLTLSILFSFVLFSNNFIINNITYIQKKRIFGDVNLISYKYINFISSGHKELIVDKKLVNVISYIGTFFTISGTKDNLYKYIEQINHLSPQFIKPYTIALNFIKDQNKNEYFKIGENGIKNTCNNDLINEIDKIDDESLLKNIIFNGDNISLNTSFFDKKLLEVCKDNQLPYLLGTKYFFIKKDLEKSKKYFKLSLFSKNKINGALETYMSLTNKNKNIFQLNMIIWLSYYENLKKQNNEIYKYEIDLAYTKYIRFRNLFYINKIIETNGYLTLNEIEEKGLLKKEFLYDINPNFYYFYDKNNKLYIDKMKNIN